MLDTTPAYPTFVHHGDGSAMGSTILYRPPCGIGFTSDRPHRNRRGNNQKEADWWERISDPWLRIKRISLIPPKSCSHDLWIWGVGEDSRICIASRALFNPQVRHFTADWSQPVGKRACRLSCRPSVHNPRRPSASFCRIRCNRRRKQAEQDARLICPR